MTNAFRPSKMKQGMNTSKRMGELRCNALQWSH